MASLLTRYKIFIASPSGLEQEREVFRKTVRNFSEDHAEPRNVMFDPWGWERARSEYNTPQETINTQCLMDCDYFILMICDRIGSMIEPGGKTSRTEGEYLLAVKYLKDESKPMRDIAVVFKEISEQNPRGHFMKFWNYLISIIIKSFQNVDKSSRKEENINQLKLAQEFRGILEKNHGIIIKFNQLAEFQRFLTKHLDGWLLDHEKRGKREPKKITVIDIEDGSIPTL